MRTVLLRLGIFVVFTAALLAVMYVVVQNQRGDSEVTLYDQYDNAGRAGWGIFSDFIGGQRKGFEQAADDFVVPTGQTWTVEQVEVAGIYVFAFNGEKARSVDIQFYEDDHFLPGTEISEQQSARFTVQPADSAEVQAIPVLPVPSPGVDTTHGSFLIPINPITLTSGVYWLSVRAELDPVEDGIQYWWLLQRRTVITNHTAAQRQYLSPARNNLYPELAGIGGWTPWSRTSGCEADPKLYGCVDLLFRLRGYVNSGTYSLTNTPTYPSPSATATYSPTPTGPTSTAIPAAPSATPTSVITATNTTEASPTISAAATATFTSVPTHAPTETTTGTPTIGPAITPSHTTIITATVVTSATPELIPTSTATIQLVISPTLRPKTELTPVRPTTTVTSTATPTPVRKQPPP